MVHGWSRVVSDACSVQQLVVDGKTNSDGTCLITLVNGWMDGGSCIVSKYSGCC